MGRFAVAIGRPCCALGLAFAAVPGASAPVSVASAASLRAAGPSALARASAAGAAQAPSAPLAGGSEYGVRMAPAQPAVTLFSVPSSAPPGRPPRVALRIDERRVATVNVRVNVHDLATRRAVVVVRMGWVRTGRTLAVSWPRGVRLAPGSYHISLAANDHHGGDLLRRAHSSGVATLKVIAAPPPKPAPAIGPPSPEAGVITPAQTVAEGAVFPVAGPHDYGGADGRFGAQRSGHYHEGQDVLTAEATPVVAPLTGVITTTAYQAAGAGYYVVEHTGVGLDFMFAHCKEKSIAVATGAAVRPGQTVCLAGQTGDAQTPHLHFEVWVGGWQAATGHPIDPLPYLQAWDRTGSAG
jgi:murein DD-endopeptidase MepM/ murein hydrolase activator NlpD